MRVAQVTMNEMSHASGTVGGANTTVFSRLENVEATTRLVFHTRAAATGKARSSTVDRRVEGTTNAEVDDERRRRRESRSVTH